VLVVIVAWIVAVFVAIVVLGFCAYELTWKLHRLQNDSARLETVIDGLTGVQVELATIQKRFSGRGAPTED
jgi:hypothetical protein